MTSVNYNFLGGETYCWFKRPYIREILESVGWRETTSLLKTDLFICDRFKRLRAAYALFGPLKRYLYYVEEPFHYARGQAPLSLLGPFARIPVMTLYTTDMYRNERFFFGENAIQLGHYLQPITPDSCRLNRTRKTVFLGMYRDPKANEFPLGGQNIDRSAQRADLVLTGHRLGLLDVHGRDWPPGVALGESGTLASAPTGLPEGFTGGKGSWQEIKQGLLQPYAFNLCPENTAFGNYITEKIWQSLLGGCLPIYSSFNNNIYRAFPRESFIDIEAFPSAAAVFEFTQTISLEEYVARFNRCIAVYNHAMRDETENLRERVLERLQAIAQAALPRWTLPQAAQK